MLRTLHAKLTLLTITVAVVVVFLATLMTTLSSTRAMKNQARTYAELLARQVVYDVQQRWQRKGRAALLREVSSLTKANEDRVTVELFFFDSGGSPLVQGVPHLQVTPLTRDERHALEQGETRSHEQKVGTSRWMQVLTPLWEHARVVGAVRVSTSMEAIQELQETQEYVSTLLAVAFALAVLVLLRIFFNRQVNLPLARLISAMNTAEAGDLQTRVPIHRHDEIGQLGIHFNRMLERLETSDTENRSLNARLQEFNEQLEARVQAMTHDLVERNQELLRLQREMARVEPLAALGRITGTIAHELGTPLNSVLGYCQLLIQEDLPAAVREGLQVIESQTRKMTDVIRHYLARTRDTARLNHALNLNNLVQETTLLLKPIFQQRHVTVQTRLAETLPLLQGEAPSLQRVLINVLSNAVDAIEDAGTITVTTREEHEQGNGRSGVVVEVQDTGTGISPEVLPHLFELFVTTKAPGNGTGLGLAICQEIVKSHGGSIDLTSELGKGTRVKIFLPLADTLPSPQP